MERWDTGVTERIWYSVPCDFCVFSQKTVVKFIKQNFEQRRAIYYGKADKRIL